MAGSVAPQAVVLRLLLAGLTAAQRAPMTPAAAPGPEPNCNGILLTYNFESRVKIRPFVSDRNKQPYAFRANATVLTSGTCPLKSWAILATYTHGEILVGVNGAVLTGGGELSYNITEDVGNVTSFLDLTAHFRRR